MLIITSSSNNTNIVHWRFCFLPLVVKSCCGNPFFPVLRVSLNNNFLSQHLSFRGRTSVFLPIMRSFFSGPAFSWALLSHSYPALYQNMNTLLQNNRCGDKLEMKTSVAQGDWMSPNSKEALQNLTLE